MPAVGAPLEDLLTEEEAAAKLKVCGRTLRKLRQAGKIPYIRHTGRCVRYSPDDLKAYIEGARQCRSTEEKAPRSGSTALRSMVYDFEEARAKRGSGRPRL